MPGHDPTPVKQLIRDLDRTDRYIVLLHYADGLTINEVALVLDRPVREVEATLNRLRGKLLRAVHEAQAEADGPPAYRRSAVA